MSYIGAYNTKIAPHALQETMTDYKITIEKLLQIVYLKYLSDNWCVQYQDSTLNLVYINALVYKSR